MKQRPKKIPPPGPDPQDYETVDRLYGPLPESPTREQRAHRRQLAGAAKLIRESGLKIGGPKKRSLFGE